MNHQQKTEIVEDAPQYRSVRMAGPLSAPPLPRSFASMRPAKIPSAAKISTGSLKLTSAPVWDVADLPALPAAYFLERTNVYVDGNAREIANRVCDCFREHSIVGSKDAEDKNVIRGETSSCLKFAVRLFADQGMVVVEVQRMCGCSFEFREAAKAVLRSAKGVKAPPPMPRSFPLPSCIPLLSSDLDKRAVEGVSIATRQLASDRLDSKIIGMESLEQMTRCRSKHVAADTIISSGCLATVLDAVSAEESAMDSEVGRSHRSILKRRALSVLANVYSILSETNELPQKLNTLPVLKDEALLSSLIDTLRSSTELPFDAIQAARCCQHLMTDQDAKRRLIDSNVEAYAAAACEVGASQYPALQAEALKLKSQLVTN